MPAGTQIASMYAKIGADASQFKREMDGVRGQLDSAKTGFDQVQDSIKTGFKVAGAAAVTAIAGISAAVAVSGMKFNALKEQALLAFTTMLGSGEKAQAMLDDLQEFAAKTPFEFPDLLTASQRLLAMGFAANDVKPLLTAVGDAVAALGGNSVLVDRVTTALGQMQAKQKVSAEEMMQLTEAGIPAWEMLAKSIGVSVPEAMEMATKGTIRADTAIAGLVAGMNERFGGMMEAQSRTFNGLLSTMKDTFTQMSGTVMAPFFEMARDGLGRIVDFTSRPEFTAGIERFSDRVAVLSGKMAEWADRVLPPLWDWLTKAWDITKKLTDAIVAVVSPIVKAIGKFVTWQDVLRGLGVVIGVTLISALGSLVAAMAPVIATIGAVSLAASALRMAWRNDFMSIRTTTKRVINDLTNWFINDSGIWRGTFADTLKYLEYWATFGWKYSLVYPVIQWLKNIRDEIKWKARDWKDALVEWIHDTKNLVRDWGIAVTEDMKRKLEYALIEIERWIKKVEINFNRWKMMNLGVFEDWGREVKEKIAGWLDKIGVLDWINKGRDIVQGLWDGFTEKWNRFTSWTGATWTSWVNRFKSFFGIRSPSALFHGFGSNIVEGLSGGINDTAFKAVQAIDSLGNKLDVAFKAVSSNMDESFKAMIDKATARWIELKNLNSGGWTPSDGKGPPIVYDGDKTTLPPEQFKKLAKQVRDTAYDGLQFGVALSKAAFNLPGITSSPDEVLSMLAQFAKSAKSAFTSAGIGVTLDDGSMVPISTNARNAMARLGDRDATMGNSTEMVVAAVQALIAELRNKGIGNQFNLEVAPSGATGDEGLLTLVQYLQALTQ